MRLSEICIRRPVFATVMSLMMTLVGVVAGLPHELLLACLFVFGLGFAGADTVVSRAVPEVFGVRAIGAVMGVLNLGWRAGGSLGPAAAGFIHDTTGSYALPFGAGVGAVVLSFALYLAGARRR